ncbi:MAG: Lrp/AsnC family transcriptional regulator [Gemmatimonadaceae bacterium]
MPNKMRPKIDLALIDRTDREILAHLQHDARMSNKTLAGKVGLAPSSCLARVRRLERSGALLGYHAEVDPRAYGATLEALIAIRLEKHARTAIAAFERHIATLSEVRGAFHVAGANDYLVHVATRDAEHLREFALSAFATRPEVAHMETSLIFSHRHNPFFGALPARASSRPE